MDRDMQNLIDTLSSNPYRDLRDLRAAVLSESTERTRFLTPTTDIDDIFRTKVLVKEPPKYVQPAVPKYREPGILYPHRTSPRSQR